MNIVTTTCVFPPEHSVERAVLRLAALGYRHLDLAIDYCVHNADCPIFEDGWEKWANALRELADKNGVAFTHSHAFGDASLGERLFRCFEVCRVLGTKYTVVHPIRKRAEGGTIESDDEFLSINVPAYKALLEEAEKNGVTVLSENLLWGATIPPASISALVEEVNSPYFGWCYDTGHANAKGLCAKTLLDVKHVPLSLHIHDNLGRRDDHSLPGDGTIDWKEFLDVLLEIGYKGDVVLEAHHQSLEAPDEQRDAILSELYKRAEKMKAYLLSKR